MQRIDQTAHPATLINAIVDESAGEFGFELVSILETEALPASEALLYERHHARLSEEWRERDQSDPPRLRSGRVQNMRSTRQNAQRRAPPFDLSQYLRDRFLTLQINHPFKVMFALALLLLAGLILGLLHGYQATHNFTWR